ncbi:hypothetical protein Mp_8g05250 [Marchantia polymorpha subsp. ruderalis]|uniref:Uncharacterized protein n=1 Tax=Marchantia polymorpha TaxID=3197 RepID=A0A2R6WKB9_MARPO|nr:hypothetical protein MARPO_0081s0026 [Marchantia polymorpha]BBN18760.1 hypothetical protein Mp_8g05250 [Marchantia polymorpha subsp. ruderalis]|eukprot:PTQ34299.1 hypothetical protein MARPO_0081s0026 [Marchantia polymorpha]
MSTESGVRELGKISGRAAVIRSLNVSVQGSGQNWREPVTAARMFGPALNEYQDSLSFGSFQPSPLLIPSSPSTRGKVSRCSRSHNTSKNPMNII